MRIAPSPPAARLAAFLLVLVLAAPVRPVRADDEEEAPAPPPVLAYAGSADVEATLEAAAAAAPMAWGARVERYGTSAGGRALLALHLGPATRPTVLVHGGLGDRDAAGTVACLDLARRLAAAPDAPDGPSWLLVPAPHPDALDAFLAGRLPETAEALRVDRDRDGRRGEDGPSDIDGDGLVLWMRRAHGGGTWRARAARPTDKRREDAGPEAVTGDPRWLEETGVDTREAPAYQLLREGLDDDGDGEVNEDPPSLDLTRQLCGTCDAVGPWGGEGPFPGHAPESRALMDLSLTRPSLVAWYGFTSVGQRLLRANERGKVADEDGPLYERLAKDLEAATGLTMERCGGGNPGSDLDWASVHLGVPAVRIPVARGVRHALDARPGDDVSELDWLLWNDEVLGGAGFKPWTPFVHPTLGEVEIGGWLPFSRHEPPAALLGEAVARVVAAPRCHAGHLPRLDLEVKVGAHGAGLFEIEVHVANTGGGPLETKAARDGRLARPVHVRLVLADGVQRLGGAPVATASPWEPGAREGPLRWLVRAAPGQGPLGRLVAHHRVAADLEREVPRP